MILQEFLSKYIGKTVGYPADSYFGQCVSLVKWYIKDCFGIDPPATGTNSAYGYWSKFPNPLGTKFKKVEYKSGMVIPCGAIPIWNTNVGDGCGHISVRTDKTSTVSSFESLDQNWSTKVATLIKHTYSNLQGWLEPLEGVIIQDMITDQTKIDVGEEGVLEVQAIKSLLHDRLNTISSQNTEIFNLKADKIALNATITKLYEEMKDITSQLPTPSENGTTESCVALFIKELATFIKGLFTPKVNDNVKKE